MTTYIFLGHGGYNEEGTDGHPLQILIPPDTSLKFYSDAGQALLLPNLVDDTDYEKVAPAWQQLKDRGNPLTATMPTYNYALYPETSEEANQSAMRADWNGATPIWVTEKTYLCAGTPQTCPTSELIGGTEEEVTNPERWKHNCTGILGRYGGNNNELHWAACTSFEIARHDLPALDTAAVLGPGAGSVKADWIPDDNAYREISNKNAANIKATDNKASASIAVGGVLVLIGEDHDPEPVSYIRRQANMEEGTLTVTKGGAFSAGSIEVKGVSSKNQDLVRASIGEFSDKKVTFV